MDDNGQRLAFAVSFGDEFDPSAEPLDGEQYLRQVIYQRKRCAKVVTRPKQADENDSYSKQFNQISIQDAPNPNLPSNEWQTIQATEFEATRKRFQQIKSRLDGGVTVENDDLTKLDTSVKWKMFCENNRPLLPFILQINHKSLEQLLDYLWDWLVDYDSDSQPEITETNRTLCSAWWYEWTYASLISLEFPLEPEIYNILRHIAKALIDWKSIAKPELVASANIIINIVINNFKQFDLSAQLNK